MTVKRQFGVGIAALAVLWMLPAMASANLLVNPGFEDPSPPPAGHAAPAWPTFTFTTSSSIDMSMPHSGNNAIVEGGGGTPTVGSTGVFQDYIGAAPGEEYNLSVWAKAGALPISTDDTNGGAVIRIVFELLGGADISEVKQILGPLGGSTGNVVTGNGLLSTEWQQFSISGIAPANTQQVKVQLYSRHSDQMIYFDDVDLTKVPEPASLALSAVALAGVALLGRRRVN